MEIDWTALRTAVGGRETKKETAEIFLSSTHKSDFPNQIAFESRTTNFVDILFLKFIAFRVFLSKYLSIKKNKHKYLTNLYKVLMYSWNTFGESILDYKKQKLIYENVETNLSKLKELKLRWMKRNRNITMMWRR